MSASTSRAGESGAARILDRADQFLARAGGSPAPADQYREIYHAALRGAAALLAERETGVRRPTRNAWLRLAKAVEQHHKLITAKAGEQVVFAHTAFKQARNAAQGVVACFMTQGIIECLETIQIQHQ